MEHRNLSLGEQVFERLETDILSGRYERGALTSELRLCAELSVSRTPVREALNRLKAEHLVAESGKGIIILGITKEDLSDIMDVRIKLDGDAAARCALCISDEKIENLREIIELQEFYLDKGDNDRIKVMDGRFHEQIYACSGSTILYEVLYPLHNKLQRYRRAALEATGRAERSVGEHRTIFEAIAAHDADKAAEAMTRHAVNAKKSLLAAIKDNEK